MRHQIRRFLEKMRVMVGPTIPELSRPLDDSHENFFYFLHQKAEKLSKVKRFNTSVKSLYKIKLSVREETLGGHLKALRNVEILIAEGVPIHQLKCLQFAESTPKNLDDFLLTVEQVPMSPTRSIELLFTQLEKMKGHLDKHDPAMEREYYCRTLTYILRETESILEALESLANP